MNISGVNARLALYCSVALPDKGVSGHLKVSFLPNYGGDDKSKKQFQVGSH